MSSFSGKQNAVDSKLIQNQSFWPALDLAEFINQYRTPSDLPSDSVESALILSIASVNHRLNNYREEQQAAGFDDLEKVPTEKINGQSIQLIFYKRAVFCQAKASVLRDWPSIDRRTEAENQSRSSEETEDRYLEFVDEAIACFMGRGFINVESV